MRPVRITQLHPRFAARVEGVDARLPLTGAQIQAVEEAMAQFAVVVIPDQPADDLAHVRFSRAFGGLELPRRGGYFNDYVSRIAPELFDAGNLDNHGEILAPDAALRRFGRGNELWHTDSSFNALPVKWSLLLAHIIPPEGGDTQFADTRTAYELLPEPKRRELDDLQVIHDLWHSRSQGGYESDAREKDRMQSVVKPLVRIAADGRKALYLGAHAASILGWPTDKSRALLEALMELATQPANVYAHSWRAGDLVIWDNRCTLHRAMPFKTFEHKRDMRRTTILECRDDRDASMAEVKRPSP
jgi:alpha-ketoglutarate-dependent 2,4-dichlorophenoxyacetate dioxygenase